VKTILLNGQSIGFDGDPEMPLLWFIREQAGFTGTKYGCGVGQCGACTVHVNGEAIRSCSMQMADVSSDDVVTTIEGLSDGENLHPVQKAWLEEDVAQCGYCQVGQIMAITAFLKEHPSPTDQDIDDYHSNLCRCGTYFRMRKAIHKAAIYLKEAKS